MATLLNITLEEACELVGKRGKTTTKDLVLALRKGGIKAGPKRIPTGGNALPPYCIVFARWSMSKNSGHWMLSWAGKIYDPSEHYETREKVVSSYIPISLTVPGAA